MDAWIGRLGGGAMLLLIALLALRCAGQLGILPRDPFEKAVENSVRPGPARRWVFRAAREGKTGKTLPRQAFSPNTRSGDTSALPHQAYKPGALDLLAAFFGVLAIQWAFAFLCWLSLRQPGALPAFFAHFWQRFTTAGDSPHYLLLARQGYVTSGEDAKYIVFYPLYPVLIRLLHTLLTPFGAGWELSALLCSQLCWGGAGAAMLRFAGRHFGREQAVCAVLLMALYPFGFFSLGVFTESLFLFLCLLCVQAAEDRHWPAAGLFCALAGLCRTQGLALLPAFWYLWLKAEGGRLGAGRSAGGAPSRGSAGGPSPLRLGSLPASPGPSLDTFSRDSPGLPSPASPGPSLDTFSRDSSGLSRCPALFGLLLAPMGFLGYLLLNTTLFGGPFMFIQFQNAPPWYQSIRWIGPNLAQHWQMAQQYPGLAPFIYHSQLALYFAGMLLLLWGLFSGRPVHWLIWGGGYTGMCYLSSWLISGSRYMFGCLPLFLLGASMRSRPARLLLLALSGWALWYFGVFYMQGQSIM